MQIYLLTQSAVGGYDTFSGCVVIAESEELAKLMHPDGCSITEGQIPCYPDWPSSPHDISATEIGQAAEHEADARVVLSSFHAG